MKIFQLGYFTFLTELIEIMNGSRLKTEIFCLVFYKIHNLRGFVVYSCELIQLMLLNLSEQMGAY